MRIRRQNYHDIERIIEFDFVRATEAAALNSLPWLGRGEKEKADAAACDALRGMFDLMNICGEVVIAVMKPVPWAWSKLKEPFAMPAKLFTVG